MILLGVGLKGIEQGAEILDAEGSLPLPRNLNLSHPLPRNRRSFIHSFIMADTDQQLEAVRKEIQEAKIEKSAALALGAEAYTAALAQLTSLQNKENILIQLQQNQGEQR